MQLATILSLVGASTGVIAFACFRQPVLALAMAFFLAYTVFDKVFPTVFSEPVVTGFSFVYMVLTLVFCWQVFSRKRRVQR